MFERTILLEKKINLKKNDFDLESCNDNIVPLYYYLYSILSKVGTMKKCSELFSTFFQPPNLFQPRYFGK